MMDEYLTDAIRNYHDDREDRSRTIAILSIAQSLDRIATAQERIATAAEQSEKRAEEYANAMTETAKKIDIDNWSEGDESDPSADLGFKGV
jgi:hypothetical protein